MFLPLLLMRNRKKLLLHLLLLYLNLLILTVLYLKHLQLRLEQIQIIQLILSLRDVVYPLNLDTASFGH